MSLEKALQCFDGTLHGRPTLTSLTPKTYHIGIQPASRVPEHYDAATIWFHWSITVLVVSQWLIANAIDWAPEGMARITVRSIHITLGLYIVVLLAARIFWRGTYGRALPPADRGARPIASKSVHYLFYLLLISVVLLGIFNARVRGDSYFDLFKVAAFDPGNKALREEIGNLPGTIASVILMLAALHASAGLAHHFLWRDGVLRRMFARERQAEVVLP